MILLAALPKQMAANSVSYIMSSKTKQWLFLGLLVAGIAAWAVFVYSVGPTNIVGFLGVKNSYAIVFALAVLGGVSSFTAAPFYATVITLAAGGANVGWLAVCAGTGLTISDSLFYYFGTKSKHFLSGKIHERIQKLSNWLEHKPSWFVPVVISSYLTFAPLPNDILMVALAMLKYPYKRLLPALLLGDTAAIFLIATLARMGYRYL